MKAQGNKDIDVVILCGGKGRRFKEETASKPKPMIEIGGKPILWHIMKYYSHFGFRKFILALGYKGDSIKKYFLDYRFLSSDLTVHLNPYEKPEIHTSSQESDWDVVCVDTGPDSLKGARVKRLEAYLKSDFFHLTYGDGLGNVDLDQLQSFHRKHLKVGTVTSVHPPSRFGEMVIENDVVTDFSEKPQLKTGYINGGFFVFNRGLLNSLTRDEKCDLEFGALRKLSHDRELMTFKHNGYWQCMDTLRELEYLNKLWQNGQAPWKVWA